MIDRVILERIPMAVSCREPPRGGAGKSATKITPKAGYLGALPMISLYYQGDFPDPSILLTKRHAEKDALGALILAASRQ
ncbi:MULTISPECIES: hypothetical protein [Paracoccus]|jgi:hypothetical protein|uniref:hypothetical protein n=1 Tax=Paracoccus TaxID=265 RepID=UPI001E583ADA|nr:MULTISPECIES: hypothetical protein [Paracoccus]MDK8872742.1 hypothetical protein [Paracoccus sp. SSJ]UFS67736.1 hypothetical protein LO749_16720 [Paracoccus denitrificans]